MSTAVFSAPVRRFVWKEYRTLRGLWLAVLMLGMLVDWLSGVLLAPPVDWGTLRLCVALAAATLYAAGAAAILFSLEHEEQTYDFLRGLPATWRPMFVGKVLLATLSAIALAAVLSVVGLIVNASQLPSGSNVLLSFGVLGMAIFEAVAWGTLCSLLFKRPLAAALATLVIGTLAVYLAVNATSSAAMASSDPESYIGALPLRLAIVVAVLGLSVAVGRGWLTTKSNATTVPENQLRSPFAALHAWTTALKARASSRIDRSHRGAMLVRLFWQSWRESWKFLMVPAVLAAICMGLGIFGNRLAHFAARHELTVSFTTFCLFWCLCCTPPLLGALAFSADQRRGSFRFLAEHAASPRYVWLGRHVVWLGTLVALMTVLMIATAAFVTFMVQDRLQELLPNPQSYGSTTYLLQDLHESVNSVATAILFVWSGALAAYAIGQFCSMLLRSEILSAFLSLVLTVVLGAWVAALIAWELNAWMFLTPLAVGFMLATWLRAPDWIACRNSWRAWVRPGLAVMGVFFLLGVMLPTERLAQIHRVPDPLKGRSGPAVVTPESVAFLKKRDVEAATTADLYLKAAMLLNAPIADSPLEPWSGPEYSESGVNGSIGGIDEGKIPAEQLKAFLAAKRKLEDQWFEQREAAVKLAIEASQRPTCQVPFQLSAVKDVSRYRRATERLEPGKMYEALDNLLNTLISDPAAFGKSSASLEQLLAGLRMSAHLRSGQPTIILVRQLLREQEILRRIAGWALKKERTNEERRAALAKLQEYVRMPPEFTGAFLADKKLIRDVITGKELPFVLNEKPIANVTYLAFLANELPWERKRALAALDVITDQNWKDAWNLAKAIATPAALNSGNNQLRRWLRPDYQAAPWVAQQPAAATSYLASMEYTARVPVNELFLEYCNTITVQRAVLIEIALAIYRADHGEYPATLDALAPDYLSALPLDPYAMQPFMYLPKGLERPLGGFGFSPGDEIPPHTPLLWSVGPNNVQLQERPNSTETTDDAISDAPASEVEGVSSDATPARETGTHYALEPANPNDVFFNVSPTDLVFRLPE
jgi:ABC-type transport system involved in multi-copper enzyme maturation permease subunit